MANLRAIYKRIKGVENTRQITRSMKMIAAAKLRKTQSAFQNLSAYADRCSELLSRTAASLEGTYTSIYLEPEQKAGRVCYVLVAGNRGLCGNYNQSLLRYCEKLIREESRETDVIVCGRWGRDIIAGTGIPVRETIEISDTPTREEALDLANRLREQYRSGKADEIVFVYQRYRSLLVQEPCSKTLLPLHREETAEEAGGAGIIMEPDCGSLMDVLLDMTVVNTVHAILLEARTGEHSARMTAMTAAADNTEELIEELTLEMNHARQSAITTEISEIAGGAEALRNTTGG